MYSQLGQDLWVLESTQFKRNGYFIDIGAYDGVFHSNTYLLEKDYGWNGVCVEPSDKYNDLVVNRKCTTCNMLVYSHDNLCIEFRQTLNNFELSGIPSYFKNDDHTKNRSYNYISKKIPTISLTTLCEVNSAPSVIDYLSIDTEGSELLILQYHDFDKYRFNYISIEHNRCSDYRNDIKNFMNSKNYYLDTSDRFITINNNNDTNFDDWYTYKGLV